MTDLITDVSLLDFLDLDAPIVDIYEEDEMNHLILTEDGIQVPASLQERLDQCGALRHKPDWKTGRRFGYYQRCGLYEYCDRCAGERAEQEKDRIDLAVGAGGYIRVINCTPVEATSLVRTLDADVYRRYPLVNGTVTVIHTDPTGPGEEKQTHQLDWDKLVRTPSGSNWSGKLGKRTPPVGSADEVDQGESKLITVPSVTFEETGRDPERVNAEAEQAWEFATLATCDINPDLEILQSAIRERFRHFVSAMEARGFVPRFFVYETVKANEKEIDWQPYNLYIRKKLGRQGYFNEALDRKDPFERDPGADHIPDDGR